MPGAARASSATTYGDGRLCASPDRRLTISVPEDWTTPTDYKGTNLWSPPPSGALGSFRTCSWSGTDHEFYTQCETERTNGWQVNVVGDESGERFVYDISCGNEQPWVFVDPPAWGATHFHLHSPNDGNQYVIDGFKAYVH